MILPNAVIISILTVTLAATATAGTPAEQFEALMKDYNAVNGGMRQATTDLERKAAAERIGAFPTKFIDLAEKFPKDAIALRSLKEAAQALCTADSAAQITWETNRSDLPEGVKDDSAARTVALLRRDYLLSPDIGPVCERLRFSYRLESGEFLRDVLDKNPSPEIRGAACLYLAQFLNDRLRMVQLAADRPGLSRRFESVFGADYLPELQRLERDGLAATVETLFERAAREFADVKIRIGGTVGEQARSELFDIRNLAVGMTAREIEGRDQDGIEFKLSDYRGKVVFLYFWMEY